MPAEAAVRLAIPEPEAVSTVEQTVERLRARPEAGQSAPPAPELPPLLLDMPALSRLLHRSEASLYRDAAAGRLPAGLRLGGSKRWRYAEIVAWVEAGCPDRRTWEATKAAANASGRRGTAGR
jgi:predicted DNA-binding transcriptional regulator AlpA